MVLFFALFACARPHQLVMVADATPVAPVAIVPGCPSEEDGTLSACQWRRVVWAHHLWASGLVGGFVTSGNAVYNRYVEAEALAAGLAALGVPADRVTLEPRALHTDENIAYALRLLEGHAVVAVASDPIQADGGCAMVNAWTEGVTCLSAPMDYRFVGARLARGVPEVRTEPVNEWVPLDEREAAIREITGWKRPPSMMLYLVNTLKRPFGLSRPPRLPE
ncbi:MAG: ElyC/SanA/YdcF family protein [Myxococcota bacterium]